MQTQRNLVCVDYLLLMSLKFCMKIKMYNLEKWWTLDKVKRIVNLRTNHKSKTTVFKQRSNPNKKKH